MIYLFNSAYRALYQENLLATLFLPYSWVNEYRYRCSPEMRNVSETFKKDVEKHQGKEDAVIIFINRFGKDKDGDYKYEYYPVRKALLLSCGEEYQQLYVRVQLLDFVYPNDTNSFENQLVEKLDPLNLPKITKNNPKEPDDGYYAIYDKNNSIFKDKGLFKFGENAWSDCVDAISKTEYFKSSENNQFVFAKAELWEHSPKYKIIYPHISNNAWYCRLLRKVNDGDAFYKSTTNRRYGFRINYKYPMQEQDTTATAKLMTKVSNNVVPRAGTELLINSRASRIIFPFTFKEPVQDRFGTIDFTFSPNTTSSKMTAPERSFSFETRYPKGYWASIIILVVVFAITGILITIDLSKVEFTNIGDYLKTSWNWLKLGIPVIQALILFCLFKLTGKKFL